MTQDEAWWETPMESWPITVPPHGTWQRYQYKKYRCRCELCRYAQSVWMRKYKVRRLVDAAAVVRPETGDGEG